MPDDGLQQLTPGLLALRERKKKEKKMEDQESIEPLNKREREARNPRSMPQNDGE